MKDFNNFNLKNYNSYKIDSVCSKAWFPESEKELIKLFSKNSEKKYIVIGNGNNVILSKMYYDEEFIILNECFETIAVSGTVIEAEAGATLLQLSEKAHECSLTGLEVFHDIPSSVGGAVVMNAGTKEGEIKDILLKVRYLDLSDLLIKEMFKEDIGFEYRNSFFQKHTDKIVLKAWFKLEEGSRNDIKVRMEETKQTRWAKQPREFPNCGSVFKRPPGRFVGPMIDELKLKGYTVGGAQVSKKHGGFIVNFNNGTGQDILDIIEHVKSKVFNKFGVELEVEQRVI